MAAPRVVHVKNIEPCPLSGQGPAGFSPPGKSVKSSTSQLGTLKYFGVFAKGLAPTLCAEMSGMAWKGEQVTFDDWPELKESGKPPFGQLPILETPQGRVLGQATAICNYIGHVANKQGKGPEEYAISQMLLAASEDIYSLMATYQPTVLQTSKPEDNNKFWRELLPGQLQKLETLLKSTPGDKFTSSSSPITPGELYLFALLHQLSLIDGAFLAATPAMQKFYDTTKALPGVTKVLAGKSSMGKLEQFYIKASGSLRI